MLRWLVDESEVPTRTLNIRQRRTSVGTHDPIRRTFDLLLFDKFAELLSKGLSNREGGAIAPLWVFSGAFGRAAIERCTDGTEPMKSYFTNFTNRTCGLE